MSCITRHNEPQNVECAHAQHVTNSALHFPVNSFTPFHCSTGGSNVSRKVLMCQQREEDCKQVTLHMLYEDGNAFNMFAKLR